MQLRSRAALLSLVLLALVSAGCRNARQPLRGVDAPKLDRKYTTFSWIEEGDLVTFLVNTRATRYREGHAYIPLEISVANTGFRQLTLTRESFTLVDQDGNRYPVASPEELLQGYEFLTMDFQLAELTPIVSANKFAAFARYPSNFSPQRFFDPRDTVGASPNLSTFEGRIVRDVVAIPKFGYIVDTIYFPEPPGGVLESNFELFLDSPELENPVFVKFRVE